MAVPVVEGKDFEAMDRYMAELAREFGSRRVLPALTRAVREATKDLAPAIRSRTPVSSGKLRKTARRVVQVQRARGGGFRVVAYAGWLSRKGQSPHHWRAQLAVEYGNRFSPERRVIRSAWEAHVGSIRENFESLLASNIIRRARELGARFPFRVR